MFYLKSNKAGYGLNLPTEIEEISPAVLEKLTKDVNLSEHYTLVCLLYKTTLFNIASQVNNGLRENAVAVTPVIAKSTRTPLPVEEQQLIRPIIAPSVIERGFEVFIPTGASINSVLGYLQHDDELRVALFQKKYTGNIKYLAGSDFDADSDAVIEDNNTPIYMLSFKIVANNDIVATVPLNHRIEDKFIVEADIELKEVE